MYTKNKP